MGVGGMCMDGWPMGWVVVVVVVAPVDLGSRRATVPVLVRVRP